MVNNTAKIDIKKGLKSAQDVLLFPLIAIVFALFVAVFFVMWAKNMGFFEGAATLFSAIWEGTFGKRANFIETLVAVTPLIFTGLAHAVAFRTGLFNIGVEGQFIMGMLAAALIGLIPGIPAPIHVILVLLGGVIFGAIWAAIPGYLKAKVGTNEVVNTIMMNFIAMNVSNYFVKGPIHREGSASSKMILESAKLYRFLSPSERVNVGLFIGIVLAILIYFLLWKTTIGYEIRAVGLNMFAAEYGGINSKKNIILAMVISGAIAGLGGAAHVAGTIHKAHQLVGFTNYGFDGIAVALLGKSHPIGVLFSSVLFGGLNSSARILQKFRIPKQIVYIIQGIIIIFVAADYIYKWIVQKRKKEAIKNA
ncbi:D-allose transporter subunit [Caloramator mitchellensis]|uniref:D-allose transporter subunit n=1 Tax=Caloramator mitchellensis TaxID=908809 RepID=A0A0R3JWT9_CALMK|nr:ABC transporter permease [Caloramator mitchellensis]KRQ88032.1 D-allose transporter subunit [Caloramator mitchellensis]